MGHSGDAGGDVPVRRSRRAVRHAGTVGGDDANLVSVLPAMSGEVDEVSPAPAEVDGSAAKGARTRDLDRSADDTDVGWGDGDHGSDDDRLTSDKPPHW
ncbi:hypothetical protein ACPPVS_02700 [Cellulomonas sp. McL0617]|uniref:hypothetical protein n=1 Tax=Cellulomonas sp. McL0617 TaxID=3415675 RepID=UPI003CED8AA2